MAKPNAEEVRQITAFLNEQLLPLVLNQPALVAICAMEIAMGHMLGEVCENEAEIKFDAGQLTPNIIRVAKHRLAERRGQLN